jgi:hypothetical protein
MKERGRYQIQFMKTRSSSGVGQKVDLEFNIDTLRISDLGEEEEGSFSQQKSQTGSSSIMNTLRRTSAVSTNSSIDYSGEEIKDPTLGIAVSKLKSSKIGAAPMIRNMLNNLNPEKD